MWHRSSNSSIDNIIKIPRVSVYHAYDSSNTSGSSDVAVRVYVGDKTKFKCGTVTKLTGSTLTATLLSSADDVTYTSVAAIVSNTEYDISAYKYISLSIQAGYQNAASVTINNIEIS